MMNMTIYVVAHKKVKIEFKEGIYRIIRVGIPKNDTNVNELQDNTGDNIANKNKNYCELTALYWIWKNDKNSNIVGISHYRRFFCDNIIKKINKVMLSEKDIRKILNKYDIIIPKPMLMKKENVLQQYEKAHHKEDIDICKKVIYNKYPQYIEAFNKVMNKHYYSQFNMMICSKELFDSYMEWLFDILAEVEKESEFYNYDDYNKRIFGFLSERLFNVWLTQNKKIKIKRKLVYNSEREESVIKSILTNIRDNIWYFFIK